MININELESRWLKYKIKSFIPYLVILVSIIVISILYLSFADKIFDKSENKKVLLKKQIINENNTSKEKIKPKIKTISPKVKEIKKKTAVVVNLSTKQINKKIILEPSLDFMIKMRDNTLPYMDNSQNSIITPVESKKTIKTTEITPLNNSMQNNIQTASIEKKSLISIDRKETHNDIEHVIKRFKKNNNPALSLFVAKKYYELKEYHKAYNYALITNEINNDIEASWIIFAKSLVKLKEKNMAIKMLKKYVSYSSSSRAKILLDNIISGKFK